MHRHGYYQRYKKPKGAEKFPMQRYLCLLCGHTVSVLPANRLPYRPLEVERLQGGFDAQAEVGTGLDPPPEPIEAGCLQRAWNRFLTRVNILTRRLWSDTTGRASHRPATVERVAAWRGFGGEHVAVSGPALQALALGRLRLFATGPVAACTERFGSGWAAGRARQGMIPHKGFLLRNFWAR